MTVNEQIRCGTCATPAWIGDRFCRSCGAENPGGAQTGIHELDLTERAPVRRTAPGRRRNLAVLVAGCIGLLFAFMLIRGGSDSETDQAQAEPTPTPTSSDVPASIYLPDNPPERQAALDAFAARRDRQWTLDKVFDAFAIEGELVIHERDATVWIRRDARGDVVLTRDRDRVEFGSVGPTTSAPYRINPDNPITIDLYDAELGRWRQAGWSTPPELSALTPFDAIAVSDTHIAADAGGLTRLWRRSDGRATAAVPGRLEASTGDLFFIDGRFYDSNAEEQYRATAGALTLPAPIRVWDDVNGDGQVQETEMTNRDTSGSAPLRSVMGQGFTAVIDRSGWLTIRTLDEPILPYNGGFVDIAAIADGTALLALSVDTLLVLRFDGSPLIEVPMEIRDARALSLAVGAS